MIAARAATKRTSGIHQCQAPAQTREFRQALIGTAVRENPLVAHGFSPNGVGHDNTAIHGGTGLALVYRCPLCRGSGGNHLYGAPGQSQADAGTVTSCFRLPLWFWAGPAFLGRRVGARHPSGSRRIASSATGWFNARQPREVAGMLTGFCFCSRFQRRDVKNIDQLDARIGTLPPLNRKLKNLHDETPWFARSYRVACAGRLRKSSCDSGSKLEPRKENTLPDAQSKGTPILFLQ